MVLIQKMVKILTYPSIRIISVFYCDADIFNHLYDPGKLLPVSSDKES